MSKPIIFTTSTCSWCRRAKRYFKERGVPYKEINIERDQDAARLAAALIRDQPNEFTPKVALAAIHPLLRAHDSASIVKAFGTLAADQADLVVGTFAEAVRAGLLEAHNFVLSVGFVGTRDVKLTIARISSSASAPPRSGAHFPPCAAGARAGVGVAAAI